MKKSRPYLDACDEVPEALKKLGREATAFQLLRFLGWSKFRLNRALRFLRANKVIFYSEGKYRLPEPFDFRRAVRSFNEFVYDDPFPRHQFGVGTITRDGRVFP